MRTFFKVVAVSSALLVAANVGAASARDWGHGREDRSGDLLAAGVMGLAAGVIAGAIVSSQPSNDGPRYVPDPPAPDYPDRAPRYSDRGGYDGGDYAYRPANYNRVRPWTRDWYRYCEDRYDSFDPDTGTYIGGDGAEHFCRVR